MKGLASSVRAELSTPATVHDVEVFPDVTSLRHDKRVWQRFSDAVVVVADLKNSTRLGMGKNVNSSVRLYRAATGAGVQLVTEFDPAFVDIQGDGFFAIFHGLDAYRRGIASAMSLAVFSESVLEPQVREFMGVGCPPTGLKTGVAAGRLAVNKIGVRGAAELVWAGKPVNRAFKCSGSADRHQIVVTRQVYDRVVSKNDYLTQPCFIPGHSDGGYLGGLWAPTQVRALPGIPCMVRTKPWCEEVAEDCCTAVLRGETRRDVPFVRRFLYSIHW
jgi:class 3 adenylate cyclase